MAAPPKSMQQVDRRELFTSLPIRIQWLHSFLEFGSDDVHALIDGQKYIKAVIPAIVNIVYKKLLKYDITARVFTTRDSRDEGPVDSWASEDSALIQHRKMFLRWYLTKLNSDCTRMEYWEYLDKVGLMHVGKGRQNALHVDYIFLGACLGFIQDSLFEAILSHPRIPLSKKIAIVKALGKVIWIQNDLIEKWHNTDGLDLQEVEGLETLLEESEKEGYLHGKKILGDDDAASVSSGKTSKSASSESGKTSLGRPIEEATHLDNGGYDNGSSGNGTMRCPFSGMTRPSTADLDRQRAASTKSPRGREDKEGERWHTPRTPRMRVVDGKVVMEGKLEVNPFEHSEQQRKVDVTSSPRSPQFNSKIPTPRPSPSHPSSAAQE